jgi:hypothetical protein
MEVGTMDSSKRSTPGSLRICRGKGSFPGYEAGNDGGGHLVSLLYSYPVLIIRGCMIPSWPQITVARLDHFLFGL